MFELVRKFQQHAEKGTGILNEYKIPGLLYPVFIREKSMDFMIMNEVFSHKCYDIDLSQSLYFRGYRKTYHIRPPQFIIDAGAHIGLTSVYYAQKYPHAKILAIEPDGENYDLLLKNTAPYPNVIPILGAVWNKSTILYVNNRSWMHKNGYLKSAEYELTEDRRLHESEVQAYTLDELMKIYDIDFVDVLKVDIEGAERVVFQTNYEQWLPKTKVLLIEPHDHKYPFSFQTVMKALVNYDFLYLQENTDLKSVLMFLLL